MSTFSKKISHHWECREQNKNFETILVILLWTFTMLYYRCGLPQVEQNLISTVTSLVKEAAERLLTQRPRKLKNIRKISNSGGPIAQCPVSLSRNKTLAIAVKILAKVDIKRFQSCKILVCSKLLYFVPDILFWIVSVKLISYDLCLSNILVYISLNITNIKQIPLVNYLKPNVLRQ